MHIVKCISDKILFFDHSVSIGASPLISIENIRKDYYFHISIRFCILQAIDCQ